MCIRDSFSCVDPWIELNPNYSKINVENDMNSDFSIHDYYKKLIKYRKGNEIVRDGDFKEIGLEDSDIFSYTRTYKGKTLLVLGSFSDKKVCYLSLIHIYSSWWYSSCHCSNNNGYSRYCYSIDFCTNYCHGDC